MWGTGHPYSHTRQLPQSMCQPRTDLGHSLQRGDQAAVRNLDVRKVSTAVTSVQDDLSLVLHFQLTLDLLQSSAIQEAYNFHLKSSAWVMRPSSPTTDKSASRSVLSKTLSSLHLIKVQTVSPNQCQMCSGKSIQGSTTKKSEFL